MLSVGAVISIPAAASVAEDDDDSIRVCATLSVPELGGSTEWPISINLSTCDIKGLLFLTVVLCFSFYTLMPIKLSPAWTIAKWT